MKTTVLLCRHGQTDRNAKNLFQIDSAALTNTGKQEITKLKFALQEKAPAIRWSHIITTGLVRTKQSAEILKGEKNIYVIDVPDLQEFRGHAPLTRSLYNKETKPERIKDFEARVIASFSAILDRYRGKNIILMLHAGTLQVITRYFMHLENVVWQTGSGRILEFDGQEYIRTICKVR